MDSFLQQHTDQGRLESRDGEFTVDLERSLRKMGESGLAEEHDYLLKVLQAAYALDGSNVRCKLGVRENSVQFQFHTRATVAPEAIGQAILGRGDPPTPAAHHLAIALKAAQSLGGGFVEWSFSDSYLRLGKSTEASRTFKEGKATGMFRSRNRRLAPFNILPGFTGAMHVSIYERARYFPIPLRLDGRLIERGWSRKNFASGSWFDYMSLPYYLAEGYLFDSDLPALQFPKTDDGEFYLVEEGKGTLVLRNRRMRLEKNCLNMSMSARQHLQPVPTLFKIHQNVSAREHNYRSSVACALPLTLTGPARLTFISDGIACVSKEVDLGCPGLLVVAPAEGLLTDLTEFSIVENEAYKQRLEQIRELVTTFLRKAMSLRPAFRLLQFDPGIVIENSYAIDVKNGLERRLPNL